MATPREHIEEIRKTKFSIGKERNPLTDDLHQAVKIFSAELYAKDVHFLMELIQNAEDNEYPEGVDPSLEFIVTSRDVTGTGASSTLLVFNNEKGFAPKNINSICSVGLSTKQGNRKRGYIGEKGIGFKSVFLITSHPYIFSNGYQIRFSEEPCPHCNVGYIVPEWIEDDDPILSHIELIYGSGTTLPTTTMVLPLKLDKIQPVKQQLSGIHPEVLLFLSKIKRLSVKEHGDGPRGPGALSAIAISSETDCVERKNIDAGSYTVHLIAGERPDSFDRECPYYMWRQKFPVKREHVVERRAEVEEWSITLAFPFAERLRGGNDSPGVYAYLPTEMITNFPFIVQADFLLASSRETILFDSRWNQGILGCVPSAFINAFRSLVTESASAPASSLPNMFRFLPVDASAYPQLNAVRDAIKSMLATENIIPCESYTDQKFFHRPCDVGRLMPAFWDILDRARNQGLSLHNLSSHGAYILSSSFDRAEYDFVLNYLGIQAVDSEWYAKCIRGSNLVLGVSEDVYLELLAFLAENWRSKFQSTSLISSTQLLKCVDLNLNASLCSIKEASQGNGIKLFMASRLSCISWLINWNREFKCASGWYSVPEATQKAISSSSRSDMLLKWLRGVVNVVSYEVNEYASALSYEIRGDRKLAITFTHFLYHSLSNDFLSEREASKLCSQMPLVDNYGIATARTNCVLVPANGSKWAKLIGSNPWSKQGYVELGEDYLRSGDFAGTSTARNELICFLKNHAGALDIPYLTPPDVAIPTFTAPLTKQNVSLLLSWIRTMRISDTCIPGRFLSCIKNGGWLKVSLGGSPSYKPPSQSFLLTSSSSSSSWGNLLMNKSVLVDIPLVDQGFYDDINLLGCKDDLRMFGVRFEFGEACQYIGERLMSLAASSSLTKTNVFSILSFIRLLRSKMLPVDDFVNSIRRGKWVRTSGGDKPPVGTVLFDPEWRAAAQISDIPFIDQEYYGEELLSFKEEIALLGVLVGFERNYQLVIDNLKSSARINPSSAEAFLLMLECIRHSSSPDKFVTAVRDKKCLKTDVGYKSPGQCFLFDPQWGCLLRVFDGFPLIDQGFYGGDIVSFRDELKQIGVVVDFEDASKRFASCFKQKSSSSLIGKEQVLAFLACVRKLEGTASSKLPINLKNCIREAQWLWTRLGQYRRPKECILFGPGWEPISAISLLPFIDDGQKYYGREIHEYKEELKSIGVVMDLKHGVDFVADGVLFPQNPTYIAPTSVLSLLECIRMLLPRQDDSRRKAFLDRVSQKKWLKTNFGYFPPSKALLFNEKWGDFLQRSDGPFIDEEFYGSSIGSYSKELDAIGVTIDVARGCALLANNLDSHSELATIVRIYNYLNKFHWKPEGGSALKIWIPEGSDNGKWVSPKSCALHDKDGLFGSRLNILDVHYDEHALDFFSRTLEVRLNPSFDDYMKLWKDWESSGDVQLSLAKCCAFWVGVAGSWGPKTQKALIHELTRLPTEDLSLRDRRDVFIADDLLLKDLLCQSSSRPIFVWIPPRSSSPSLSRTKLLDIYVEIGVRCVSEAVQMEHVSITDGVELKPVSATKSLLRKELCVLVLGFLAGPSVGMEAEKRHGVVQRLLNLAVFETEEPFSVSYRLALSSGDVTADKGSRMVRWDRENSKLFTQKIDQAAQRKTVIEFATYFSEVVSEGLLWDLEEGCMRDLSELIKLAFLVEFDEEAVGFLMKNKNMQIYEEDEEFLSAAFPAK